MSEPPRDEPPRKDPPHAPTAAVHVRLRVPGRRPPFSTDASPPPQPGSRVIVETELGPTLGTVQRAADPRHTREARWPVVRVATPEDEGLATQNRARELEAREVCREAILQHGLPMKLIDVESTHNGARLVFTFTSEDRVDFRTLVRDLARRFHTRIELRQVGVRDAARHVGGAGVCGRELCCSSWLPEFAPISIRMAKDQNLALTQDGLSGVCGRLRCCLAYEQETYEADRRSLPKLGKRVLTPKGEGRVKDVNVLKKLVRVQLADGSYEEFRGDALKKPADVEESQARQREAEERRAAEVAAGQPPTKRRRKRRKRKPGDAAATHGLTSPPLDAAEDNEVEDGSARPDSENGESDDE